MTSYFIEKEAKNLQNGDIHIAQIPDFEMEYLENHLRIEVGDGSLFCIFHALSFELNLFFDRRFPVSNFEQISSDDSLTKILLSWFVRNTSKREKAISAVFTNLFSNVS